MPPLLQVPPPEFLGACKTVIIIVASVCVRILSLNNFLMHIDNIIISPQGLHLQVKNVDPTYSQPMMLAAKFSRGAASIFGLILLSNKFLK